MNAPQKNITAAAMQQDLNLAVIGNGRTAALVNPQARIVWWCFPRFDSEPVFCRLLAGDEEKGFADVLLDGFVSSESAYERNTAVVTTVLTDRDGGAVRITDFAPRFSQYGRTFRPPQLVRIIEPIAGLPRITIRFRPTAGHGETDMQRALSSNHIRYSGHGINIRLTTDAPLAYIDREAPFVMTRPVHLVFGTDTPFEGELATTCREFADRTRDYWQEWIRRLNIGYEWQDAVIRTEAPCASVSTVLTIAVLRTYSECEDTMPSSTTSVNPFSSSPDSSLQNTGSPSKRGMHHHTIRACGLTSAAVLPLPNRARSRDSVVIGLPSRDARFRRSSGARRSAFRTRQRAPAVHDRPRSRSR